MFLQKVTPEAVVIAVRVTAISVTASQHPAEMAKRTWFDTWKRPSILRGNFFDSDILWASNHPSAVTLDWLFLRSIINPFIGE